MEDDHDLLVKKYYPIYFGIKITDRDGNPIPEPDEEAIYDAEKWYKLDKKTVHKLIREYVIEEID